MNTLSITLGLVNYQPPPGNAKTYLHLRPSHDESDDDLPSAKLMPEEAQRRRVALVNALVCRMSTKAVSACANVKPEAAASYLTALAKIGVVKKCDKVGADTFWEPVDGAAEMYLATIQPIQVAGPRGRKNTTEDKVREVLSGGKRLSTAEFAAAMGYKQGKSVYHAISKYTSLGVIEMAGMHHSKKFWRLANAGS